MSKEDYLKRYLASDEGEKKKTRKKKISTKTIKIPRMKIVDEDADVPLGGDHVENHKDEIEEEIEENPVVVFVNNRTDELEMIGKFKKISNWETLDDEKPSCSRENGKNLKKNESDSDGDRSISKKRRRPTDRDQSPIRRRIKSEPDDDDHSPIRRCRDSDSSPSRRKPDGDSSPIRRRPDRDNSPVRKQIKREPDDDDHSPIRRRRDSDSSPIRRKPDGDSSPIRRRRDSDSSPSRRRPDRDNSPIRRRLKNEPDSTRNRPKNEPETQDETGRHAKTIKRQHFIPESKKKREPTEEEKRRAEDMKEKYKIWNKGVKQVKEREEKLKEMADVVEKPLARYEGDEDLEAHLKDKMLADDPMLKYMQIKRIQEGKDVRDKPVYRGPPALPNRYGILPGYRWDGVDRSNGFEKKLLSQKNLRKAEEDDYYQWSSGHQD